MCKTFSIIIFTFLFLASSFSQSNSSYNENIIISPDSIFLNNFNKYDSCKIINNSNSKVYLDSVINISYSSFYCSIKLNDEYLVFHFNVSKYKRPDSLNISINPNDTLIFIIEEIDACPICKINSNYLFDTLFFYFSSDSVDYLAEKFLIINSDIPLVVEDENFNVNSFQLFQNYPNPFNPSTKIKFTISNSGFTNLKIFDVLGNEIATLVDEYKPAGSYEIEFNSNVSANNYWSLTSGIYFYQLKAGNNIQTKKMILMK